MRASLPCLLAATLAAPALPQTIHVDDDAAPGGDGTSWASALDSLDEALARTEALGSGEIWVAEGVYRPGVRTDAGDARSVSFSVPLGTILRGGFAGDERRLEERILAAHPAVLSGDLLGDDFPSWGARLDNAYHVVRAGFGEPQVVIDGFTVTGGNADGSGEHADGGGLHFEGTSASSTHSPRILNCVFVDNQAHFGGAVWSSAHLVFESCRFLVNRAVHVPGTGMFQTGVGGAVANLSFEPVVLHSSVLSANDANIGGALYGDHSSYMVVNSTLAHNVAASMGGAIFRFGTTGFLSVTNSILVDNSDASGDLDSDALTYAGFPELLVVDACLVQNWSGSMPGSGSFDADPQFLDPLGPDGVAGSGDERLRPSRFSPALERGRLDVQPIPKWPFFTALPLVDVRGEVRVLDGDLDRDAVPDLGAYEYRARFFEREL